MTRIHGDEVTVQRGDVAGAEAPERFLWHDRLYVVRAVQDHWMESRPWWRATATRSDPALSPRPAGLGVDDRERQVWRVEAAAGRTAAVGVFDLDYDESSGRWSLRRVQD